MATERKPIPHPESLIEGERWFVSYSDHVSAAKVSGEYRGFVVEYKTLWLLFAVRGEHSPRQVPYKSILSMTRVA